MVRIRIRYDFSDNTIFKLINSYWVETLKARNNPTWKYLWWKVDFKKQCIGKKMGCWFAWFDTFINKIDELCDDSDTAQFVYSERYIEKLMKISEELKKNKTNWQKRHNKILATVRPLRWWIFSFLFDLFNWGNQSLYILSKIYFMYFTCFFLWFIFGKK